MTTNNNIYGEWRTTMHTKQQQQHAVSERETFLFLSLSLSLVHRLLSRIDEWRKQEILIQFNLKRRDTAAAAA